MKRRRGFPFVFCMLLIASCSEDDEGTTVCNGISDFVAVWNMNDHCGSNDFQYPLTITENSTGGIQLTNLGGLGPNSVVNATVSGASLTIPPQTVQGLVFSGNGSLNAGCVQLTIIWGGGPNGDCSGTGTK